MHQDMQECVGMQSAIGIAATTASGMLEFLEYP